MGNVKEQKLLEIWRGEKLRRFRALFSNGNVAACMGCCNLTACSDITFDGRDANIRPDSVAEIQA